MVHTSSSFEMQAQMQTGGRALAATVWMDRATAESVGVGNSWRGEVRYGASCDAVSLAVREVVDDFREYIEAKVGGVKSKLPKREQEVDLLSLPCRPKLAKTLANCKVVALGWRPSPFGGGQVEEWGGGKNYAKACGHNEVAMFFVRPFVPMEVLNTHVCSKNSPAPGNEGHDGCLEFLSAQCRFFRRAYSLWDDKYFHFIDQNGAHEAYEKKRLLVRSEVELKILLRNMRHLLLTSSSSEDNASSYYYRPSELIELVDLYMDIASGAFPLHAVLSSSSSASASPSPSAAASSSTIYKKIASFLLVSSSNNSNIKSNGGSGHSARRNSSGGRI